MKTFFTLLTDISGTTAMLVLVHTISTKAFREKYEKGIIAAIVILLLFALIGAMGELAVS
jgi:hypothetical protein